MTKESRRANENETPSARATQAAMLAAADRLSRNCDDIGLRGDYGYYNPLSYARNGYAAYIHRFCAAPRRVLMLGMNPGPWGMAQTGVPFGEITAVRDWMGLHAAIEQPRRPHPKRPVDGFACRRSEVSGRRLWGLMARHYGSAEACFGEILVLNYFPLLVFAGGRNVTPDKLPTGTRQRLFTECDRHLRRAAELLQPQWLIAIGAFAEKRIHTALPPRKGVRSGRILHPSPANPAANRGWSRVVTRQLIELGVW